MSKQNQRFFLLGTGACKIYHEDNDLQAIKDMADFGLLLYDEAVSDIADALSQFSGWGDYAEITEQEYKFLNSEPYDTLSVVQIPTKALPEEVVKVLEGIASFTDTDKDLNEFLVSTATLLEASMDAALNEQPKADLLYSLQELYDKTSAHNYIMFTKI